MHVAAQAVQTAADLAMEANLTNKSALGDHIKTHIHLLV